MNKQRVLWFQDSIKLKTSESRWRDIDQLTKELFTRIGHPEFEQVIIDPLVCVNGLFQQLDLRSFSCVIDLSGFLGKVLIDQNHLTPVIDDLHLSRVRVVTSPRLDTAGYVVSLGPDEINRIKSTVDLSRPLLLDDISWSGRTLIETVRLLDINHPSATFGLLTVNEGCFGESNGALQLLLERGGSVFAGSTVVTPRDDGFHLADFNHPSIETIFDIIIKLQKLREKTALAEDKNRKEINREIEKTLRENQKLLFPHALTTEEMKETQAEGRLISAGINKNSLFDINPPNWFMPSFSKRVQSSMLADNRDSIIGILRILRDIMDQDKETKSEIKQEAFQELQLLRSNKERF